MPVVSYRVGFLPDLLAPFATLRSLLEVGGSTSNYAEEALAAASDDLFVGHCFGS
jgi:hypothetical protein